MRSIGIDAARSRGSRKSLTVVPSVALMRTAGYPCLLIPAVLSGLARLTFTLKSAPMIFFAAGAALSTPKPPFSIVTATTYFGFGYGASATYHDWSPLGGRSAVPVLPATLIGNELSAPNTGYDVPLGCSAAAERPSRIAWR